MIMFKFRRTQNDVDTSLFDPEQDMDLVIMIESARTEDEIQSVVRISNARMRARRKHLMSARRPHAPESTTASGYAPPSSAMRGL
jgi:hypothetical protein